MISFVKGKVFELTPTYVVVDVHDIGYHIAISLHTYGRINPSEPLLLYTVQIIRDDAHLLYGFFKPLEREIFKLLISVSGIGANTALLILSAMTPKEVQQVIANEDVVALKGIKGIGAKTAQRAIIELKDKILKTYDVNPENVSGQTSPVKDEALSALEALGFPKKRADKIIADIIKEKPEITLEETIKEALKRF
ncbi:MAG TPA: Holliday junction branch migration protein RuvA [Flavobacteriia bacterium]|jgi:Holliday junction DNA helicase RuvA|nr:Holliday junction branch migration protein RuvA [Flavobacteriia bacterium]